MSKLIGLAIAAMLLLPFARAVSDEFAKYKRIEAYEIWPGILVMPRYSVDGEVCEIGLQKLNYSPEIIRLDPYLSHDEIDQVFDILVPVKDRGPRSRNFTGELVTRSGLGMTFDSEFENVSIIITAVAEHKFGRENIPLGFVAATAKWKSRTCK